MVTVSFYNNGHERTCIEKGIVEQGPAIVTTAELYDNTDVLKPELKVAWRNEFITLVNYVYIAEFNRFYFIDDVVAEPGGAARLKCSIDVMYTYRNCIKATTIFLTRAAQPNLATAETYIKDSQYPLYLDKYVQIFDLKFDVDGPQNPFNLKNPSPTSCNFVLNIMGRRDNS